jgi:hypothetical protein
MNCSQVQDSLPVYVGGDLAERWAHSITVHLQCCANCAEVANEYRETREMLRDFTPPAFAEGTYAGIRQRVLREIENERIAPAWPKMIANLFRPRLAWALATALLIAITLFAAFFIANRWNVESPVTEKNPKTVQPNANDHAESRPPAKNQTGLLPSPNLPRKGERGEIHQRRRNAVFDRVREQMARAGANAPDTSLRVSMQPDNPPQPALFPPRDPTASEKALRLEIQTKDPNIRIIWFTQREPKPALPNSKGT